MVQDAQCDLTSIDLSENGQFTFWHEDGGIFQGHYIEVRGNLKEGLTSADITG